MKQKIFVKMQVEGSAQKMRSLLVVLVTLDVALIAKSSGVVILLSLQTYYL